MRVLFCFVISCAVLCLGSFSVEAGEDAGRAYRQKLLRAKMLQYFSWGTTAPFEWIKEVNSKHGARWDFQAGYISGSVTPGTAIEEQWYFKYGAAENTLREAPKQGCMVWWTWYTLAQSYPAYYKPGPAQATPINAKEPEVMRLYFESVKKLFQMAAKYPETIVAFQIEPDEWGHLWLSGGQDPKKVNIKIGSSGMEELKGLPDDLFGYAAAFEKLRDLYAPKNVLLGCNPSGWDHQGTMSGQKMGELFRLLCPNYDFAVFETGDRDKGGAGKTPPFGDTIDITGSLDNHIKWISEFHKVTGLYVWVWQVAMGNTYFATCNATEGHHMDNLAQMLLEDYPRNPTIARYVQAGCAGFVFQGGQGFSTQCWDAKKDGVTNPTPVSGNLGKISEYADDDGGYIRLRVSAYYKQPFPILGKPLAGKSDGGYNPLFGKPRAKPKEDSASSSPSDTSASVAANSPEKKEPPEKIEKKAEPVAAKKKSPDAALLNEWNDKLKARLKAELASGKSPRFLLKAMRANAKVKALKADELVLAIDNGGQLNLAWSQLQSADCAALAAALVKDGAAADHALAAFFQLAEGSSAQAHENLAKSGAEAAKIRAAFGL
jgi:hypothetical protein